MNQNETIDILVVDDDPKFIEEYVITAFSKENDWTPKALPNLDFNITYVLGENKYVDSQEEALNELKRRVSNYHIALVDLRLRKSSKDEPHEDEEGGIITVRRNTIPKHTREMISKYTLRDF